MIDVKNRHKFKHKEYISIRPPESRIEAVNRSLEEKFDNFRERVNNAIPPGTGCMYFQEIKNLKIDLIFIW